MSEEKKEYIPIQDRQRQKAAAKQPVIVPLTNENGLDVEVSRTYKKGIPTIYQAHVPADLVWLYHLLNSQRSMISDISSRIGCIFALIITALIIGGIGAALSIFNLIH